MIPFNDLAIQLNPADNVAIARRDISAGIELVWGGELLRIRDNVPAGHKLALRAVPVGTAVLRYGAFIGFASQPIQPGEWVHSHNLIAGELIPTQTTGIVLPIQSDSRPRTFLGYTRADGRAGTRNLVAVVSTVNCAAGVAQAVARHFTRPTLHPFPNVDGVLAVTHDSGCSLPPGSLSYTHLKRTLTNLLRHPNLGGCLLIGLGCEVMQAGEVCAELEALSGAQSRVPILVVQQQGGSQKSVAAGIRAVHELLAEANRTPRTPQPLSRLCVALQCGGSDSWSGISANPLVGLVADQLVAQGASVVLAETPEIYGAAHLLTSRAASPEVARGLEERVRWWEQHAAQQGFVLDNNPTPGNKAGGLTTIYEKSLGAVSKGGSSPLNAVVDYAERVEVPGLVFMDTPGNDPISLTGQVAGGCNLVLFTTGRGTIFGSLIAPTIKVASHSALYRRMTGDMDFNAGTVLEGEDMRSASTGLFEYCLAVASGVPTCLESSGQQVADLSPWLPGGIL